MKSEKIRQDRRSSDLLDSPQYLKDQIVTSPPAIVFTEILSFYTIINYNKYSWSFLPFEIKLAEL